MSDDQELQCPFCGKLNPKQDYMYPTPLYAWVVCPASDNKVSPACPRCVRTLKVLGIAAADSSVVFYGDVGTPIPPLSDTEDLHVSRLLWGTALRKETQHKRISN